MTAGEIIALVTSICAMLGVVVSLRRNGREDAAAVTKRREELAAFEARIKTQLEHIQEEMKSPDHGLVALAKAVGKFETHCATVSTALAGEVNENARDIAELKGTNK